MATTVNFKPPKCRIASGHKYTANDPNTKYDMNKIPSIVSCLLLDTSPFLAGLLQLSAANSGLVSAIIVSGKFELHLLRSLFLQGRIVLRSI